MNDRHPYQSDHDRLIRIEEAIEHLNNQVETHTRELREHIADESLDLKDLRQKLILHLHESENIQAELRDLKDDLIRLKNERLRLIGWVSGIVASASAIWLIVNIWLDHFRKGPYQ